MILHILMQKNVELHGNERSFQLLRTRDSESERCAISRAGVFELHYPGPARALSRHSTKHIIDDEIHGPR